MNQEPLHLLPAEDSEDDSLLKNELRYLEQRNALIALTRREPDQGIGIEHAFRRITETSAKTLGVERVSIWAYHPDRTRIECVDLYEAGPGTHSSGMTLLATDFPSYFKGLSEMELIVADDAHSNAHTSEFSRDYLTPLGIASMMDAPIHLGDSVEYLICHEHVGPPRTWTADEKTFVIAIANLASLALEANERTRAEAEAAASHQRFQSVAAATNDTIWDWNIETNSFWWNDGFANLFGWTASEIEPTIHAWIRQIHNDDRDRVVKGVYEAIESGKTHWTDEYRFVSNSCRVAYVLDRGQIIRDDKGKPLRMVGGMSDLTANKLAQLELARSHRALQMLSSCNELLIRATDESVLLDQVCRLAVEVGGYRMAWVGYAMEDHERTILPMAHAGEQAECLSGIEVTWDGDSPAGMGPAARTIRSGVASIHDEIMREPELSQWHAAARIHDFQGLFCLPLSSGHRTFGLIMLIASKSDPAGEDELKLLRQMANDLAFGIQNIRGRLEKQRAQEVVLKVAQAVSSDVGEEFFDLLTCNMVEALGADGGGIGHYDPDSDSIQSLCFYLDGKKREPITYSIAGTPCGKVVNGHACLIPQEARQRYPDDAMLVEFDVESYAGIPLFNSEDGVAGIMVVFFHRPIRETALVESTLRIFAARAAAELGRQQADARIREQASLLDKAQDAIIVRDLDHKITFWNKSAERLYGWSSSEAVGKQVTDLLHRETTQFYQACAQALCSGEWVGEMRHRDKHDRDLTIESRWTLVRDGEGRPKSMLVIDTDVSEHRKLEQQFLRAQRLESIGTLAGGIAHDLNNILSPITMAVELLKMRSSDARGDELLDTIAASAKRGSDMVSQVLSFARGMEGRRVEVHPMHLISEVEKILRDTFLKTVRLSVHAFRDLWTVRGDPTQLHQVLINLCVNARDAVGGDGHISIRAENVEIDESYAAMNLEAKVGPHVCISVEDNGSGIPPQIMDKIFDPFFTTKSVGKGTGLGLSTSLAIVKSHGGFIRTFSERGTGTRFRIYLPAFPEAVDADPPPVRADLPHGNGEMVLIVDDEAFIRKITQQTLETFGYRTCLASSGQQAVDFYASNPTGIDVVITDMMMPGIDGAETIRLLMQINPCARIIATSGIVTNRELAYAAGSGVVGFLPKPCTTEMLLQTLQHAILIEPQQKPCPESNGCV